MDENIIIFKIVLTFAKYLNFNLSFFQGLNINIKSLETELGNFMSFLEKYPVKYSYKR
jgi:hypothetical protein